MYRFRGEKEFRLLLSDSYTDRNTLLKHMIKELSAVFSGIDLEIVTHMYLHSVIDVYHGKIICLSINDQKLFNRYPPLKTKPLNYF